MGRWTDGRILWGIFEKMTLIDQELYILRPAARWLPCFLNVHLYIADAADISTNFVTTGLLKDTM